jgi:hypothetical protein
MPQATTPRIDEILGHEGFRRIGSVRHQLEIEAWWNDVAAFQMLVVHLGDSLLLKGSKPYFLRSIGEDGETWARDIPNFYDYLEAHFPEMHVSLAFFRDVSPSLVARHVARRRMAVGAPLPPSASELASLQRRLERARDRVRSTQLTLRLDSGDSSVFGSHLRTRLDEHRAQVDAVEIDLRDAVARAEDEKHLQSEYLRKGSALCLIFSVCSNLQVVPVGRSAIDAVRAITKEIEDSHRFQVAQKLCGGQLRLQIEPAKEPTLAWLEEWFGGALAPLQLERMLHGEASSAHLWTAHHQVAPKERIEAEGELREDAKLIAPRALHAMIARLDRTERLARRAAEPSATDLPLSVGRMSNQGTDLGEPCSLPLRQFNNAYVSGATGSGKSFLVRVLIEEAAAHAGVSILVLDPRNQSAGLLVPEDRPSIIERYPTFGLSTPTAFVFEYSAPRQRGLPSMPQHLSELSSGRRIVSLKGLDDAERCAMFADVLESVFAAMAKAESETVRLVVLVEEAQLFTRRHVDERARSAAERAELVLDRVLREGRKFGLCVIVSSQSMRDFSHGAAGVRQNTNTKVFLHNSDREVEYARDFLDNPRDLVQLPNGTALACNPAWGVARFAVRPPRSKVWEFSDEETRGVVQGVAPRRTALSSDAKHLLQVLKTQAIEDGRSLNMSEAGHKVGVTSKRHLGALIHELEQAGMVRTRKLAQRGQPRVIELNEPALPDRVRAESRHGGRKGTDAD